MFGTRFQRLIHHTCCNFAVTKKSHLVKLRKKTGLSFSNCKKALEASDNDFVKAEQWLKEKAQALGWAKAAEVEGKKATKGLIGLAVDKTHAALIEINCETEFITRNKQFQSLIELAANSCLNHSKEKSEPGKHFSRLYLDTDSLKQLTTSDGKTLADHTALVIGVVGENLQLKRATCIAVGQRLRLTGFIHPASDLRSSPLLGDYGSILVYKPHTNSKSIPDVVRQLCQHIIGMNPSRIGSISEDSPAEDTDFETVMIFQEFLFNPEVTIQQVLDVYRLDIVGFERYECGELYRRKKNDVLETESIKTGC